MDVKLNELQSTVESLPYPISREAAVQKLADTTLRYADGSEPLSAVLRRASDQTFHSEDELVSAVYNNLPTEAVGEPGQSEGEG